MKHIMFKSFLSLLFTCVILLCYQSVTVAGEIYFYIYDNPGRTVTSIIDSSTNTIDNYKYDSFGNILNESKNVTNSFKYMGEQYDKESSLVFLRNRYYDPKIGRFINKDPVPGRKEAPQTLNAYIYVGNNPVNFIDSLGLWYVDFNVSVGWWGGVTFGLLIGEEGIYSYMGGGAVTPGVSGAIMWSPQDPVSGWNVGLQGVAGVAGQYGYSFGDEGGSFFEVGIGGAYPTLAGASLTAYYVTELWTWNNMIDSSSSSSLSTDTSVDFSSYFDFDNNVFIQDATNLISSSSLVSSSFGGVSLSTTAQLMLDINDIEGATYDEATGQVIFFGRQDTSLPEMDLDDLAVAVKSIYEKQQDPGVSIGTEPSDVSGYMKVRYDGATAGTEFGEGMFESDRQLKILSLGKDNETGQSVTSGVSGYKNMLDRYREAGGSSFPEGESSDRMWFVPKEIVLSKSADDNDMVYDSVVMELLTESKFEGDVSDNPVAEGFADHFTQHYQEFAAERPILKELERLGKIVGVVKWIKDNDIPFDLSFVENYAPEYFDTDEYTPETTVSTSWTEGDKIYTFEITGGVAYTQPNEYQDDSQNNYIASETAQAATTQRPSETDFSWDFSTTTKSGRSETYTAVAQSLTRSRKDGNIKRRETDMNFPVEGDFPLALTRYYDSFSDKPTGFGMGWEITPYELRFPADKRSFSFGEQGLTLNLYHQIYLTDRTKGREDIYYLLGIDNNNLPLYARDGGADILYGLSDATFRLDKANNTQTYFDSSGRLNKLSDKNGIYITYNYNGENLSSITHQAGRTINIAYSGDNITSIQGPANRIINYTYNTNGDLETVTNQDGQTTTYYYDSDKRLQQIVDGRSNIIYQADYDEYNRASAQTVGLGANYSSDFNLAEWSSTTYGPNNTKVSKLFDTQYRMTQSENVLNSRIDISYAGDYGPETITDTKGNTTYYEYDSHGNVSYVLDAQGNESWFYYDANDNLVAKRDSRSFDTAYGYDENNRLATIYHRALLNYDEEGNLTSYNYDPENISTLNYDPANGNLLSITDAQGNTQGFSYDGNGMPTTISRDSGYQTSNTYDGLSRLTEISNVAGESVSFGYTNADQIESIITSAGTVRYQYDKNNNVDIVYDAKENPTDYGYDENNNLKQVIDAESGTTTYEYDILNNLTQINLPNGAVKKQEFDELNRPIIERNIVTNPKPRIGVVVENLDFGSTALAEPITKQLSIYNIGDETLNITDISVDNSNFSFDTTSTVITAGSEFKLDITLTSQIEGEEAGALTITSDDAVEPAVVVNLGGQITLPSLNISAQSDLDGIRLSWNAYSGLGSFSYYALYREASEITDIGSLTPITTISDINTISYLDNEASLDSAYYYAVVAFSSGAVKLTVVDSFGPITFLNLGKVGSVIEINSAYQELSPAIAYNSANNEYILVYEKSGDIYGQLVSAQGGKIGSEFVIFASSYTERNPDVVYNSTDNEYLVVFEVDVFNTNVYYHIAMQRLSATGSLIDSAYFVYYDETRIRKQSSPSVVYNSLNNQYFISFDYDYTGDGYEEIMRFIYSADGNYVSGSFIGFNNLKAVNVSDAYNSRRNQYLTTFEVKDSAETFSYILGYIIDSNNVAIGNLLYIGYFIDKSFYPYVTYNPDRDEYVTALQYDYSTGDQFIIIRKILGNGTVDGDFSIYWSDGQDMLKPTITYTDGRDEYLFSFTYLYEDNEYNVQAQRIAGADLALLTEYTISVATESSVAEQNSDVVYNNNEGEFLVGYEYNNQDVRAQRIGNVSTIVEVNPASLDFASDLTQQQIEVTNTGGTNYMYLINSTDQDWLSVSPGSVYVVSQTPSTTLQVSVDRNGLAPGDYLGNININYQTGTIDIPVSMSVVNSAPTTPSEPIPIDGAVDQSDMGTPLSVTLNWQASDPDGHSLTYNVYFSDNQTFVDNADSSALVSANQSSNSYKASDLNYVANYYWRIKAKDQYSAESLGDTWRFSTISIPAPTLTSYTPDPTNNTMPTLNWESVSGASKYHLQIDNNSDFSSPIVDDNTLTTTSFIPILDLPEGAVYWRVSSIDANGNEGDYSMVDSFTIDVTAPTVPTLNTYSPDPTNNQRPSLSWQEAADASSYHLQISNVSDFSSAIIDTYQTTTNYTPSDNLPEGAIYWRVSSKDLVGNESEFSDVESFTIDATAPAQITGLNAVKDVRDVLLNWDTFTDTDLDFGHFNIYRDTVNISNVSGLSPISENITDPSITTFTDTTTTHQEIYYYAVTAVDVLGNENKSVIPIGPVTINEAPVLEQIGDKFTIAGESLSFVIVANDPDTEDSLTYSAVNLPEGASFDTDTQTFSWVPSVEQQGIFAGIKFKVTDGADSDYETISIMVFSPADLEFTDDPLIIGQTRVKAVHIEELRLAVDELRAALGLSAYPWADPTLEPKITKIKAVHINELRSNVEEIYTSLGLLLPVWNEIVEPGVKIRAEHVEELRNAIAEIYGK